MTVQTIAKFDSAAKRSVANVLRDVRSQLKTLGAAETAAHTKAVKAINSLPALLPVTHTILYRHWYVCQGTGNNRRIVRGPYKTTQGAAGGLRTVLFQNKDLNPLALFTCRGNQLSAHRTKFSPDFVLIPNKQKPVPTPRPVTKERIAKQRAELELRRNLARAQRKVSEACHPGYNKLYVVNTKTTSIESGPYTSLKAAQEAALMDSWCIVMAGRQILFAGLRHTPKFNSLAATRFSADAFAVGLTVLVNGRAAKIESVNKKARTFVADLETFSMDECSLNFAQKIIIAK